MPAENTCLFILPAAVICTGCRHSLRQFFFTFLGPLNATQMSLDASLILKQIVLLVILRCPYRAGKSRWHTNHPSAITYGRAEVFWGTKDLLAPLKTIVQAAPISTPEKCMSLSSPIIISSISLQLPSFVFWGFSKVEAISPPASKYPHKH